MIRRLPTLVGLQNYQHPSGKATNTEINEYGVHGDAVAVATAGAGQVWAGVAGMPSRFQMPLGHWGIGAGPKADQESAAFRSFRNGVYQEKEVGSPSAALCRICA